jgi:AcrR family transcriptional regulator
MAISAVIAESTSRTERKRARNREALVAAARRLFVDVGFEATTIAAIAEAADLGFGTFYRYFADKEAILDALLDTGRLEIDEVLAHPENDALAPAASLTGLTARFTRAVRRNLDVFTLIWRVGMRGDGPGAKRIRVDQIPPEQALPTLLAEAIRRIVERGVASGEFKSANPRLVAHLIAASHMYVFSPTAIKFGEQALIQTLCEFELHALRAEVPREAPRAKGRKGR